MLYFRTLTSCFSLLLICAVPQIGSAQDAKPTSFPFALDGVYNEIETKYIFGFTDGSDIGAEGEKAIELETNGAFRKRHGRYSAIEQEVEFEAVPTQFFAYELSGHGTAHAISGVDGLDNLHRVTPSGLSARFRYLLIGRGPGSPIGLTITAEPEWSRVDGTSGMFTRSIESTFKILADTELIPNRLFAAGNLSYAPEIEKAVGDPVWTRSSTFGTSGALAWRFTPKITVGAEAQYFRAYESFGFKRFQGHAVYVGPTLHIQITNKIMFAAAYSTQVAGHAAGDDQPLDLVNFSRHRARLRFEYEF
jgi:outer membrane putative beta-barrel porin/alpha-amylase